ncbi:CsbD family protein [Streptococcus ruminicola]|uniref:CsbD family protein n=1 Tax=Streptococcus ruminicola TaxID=2686210 RepID=UPI002413F8C3|nr:CsbD family protein [Streptococcus ruminicola]WFM81848.1 CsbD family protein [Streptococcus ruminicola]
MSDEKYKAKLHQVKGSLKEGLGKVTGDKKVEIEGLVDKTLAKGREIVDDIKEGSEGAVDSIKKALDKKK